MDRFQICIALATIKKMLSLFIKRRVDEFKSSGNTDFRYVATHDNSGDIVLHQEEWVQMNHKNASYGGTDQTDWTKTKVIGQCGTLMK